MLTCADCAGGRVFPTVVLFTPSVLQCNQAVSSRPDVVPPLYLRELEKLQDQIPPFPNDDAFAVIQLETGQPPAGMFSELGATTIAAASLGQVLEGV